MLLRRPKLSCDSSNTSFELLKDALVQYGVDGAMIDPALQLKSLSIDDIDFLEAIQLIEKCISARIDKGALRPHTTVGEVIDLIDYARFR